eukprot:4742515-Amphidinium_carterae.2
METLDCSLRTLHELFALLALTHWRKRVNSSDRSVPLKNPGLFPVRRLFGSSGELLGPLRGALGLL